MRNCRSSTLWAESIDNHLYVTRFYRVSEESMILLHTHTHTDRNTHTHTHTPPEGSERTSRDDGWRTCEENTHNTAKATPPAAGQSSQAARLVEKTERRGVCVCVCVCVSVCERERERERES